jgi:hypothetical protein
VSGLTGLRRCSHFVATSSSHEVATNARGRPGLSSAPARGRRRPSRAGQAPRAFRSRSAPRSPLLCCRFAYFLITFCFRSVGAQLVLGSSQTGVVPRLAGLDPRLRRARIAFGKSPSPLPSIDHSLARSTTSTLLPARVSARAADSPAIPAPTIKTSASEGIAVKNRRLGAGSTADRGRRSSTRARSARGTPRSRDSADPSSPAAARVRCLAPH